MKKYLFSVALLLFPLMAFSQKGHASAYTTEPGMLTEMILSQEHPDSIVWLSISGIISKQDIETLRSLPLLKTLHMRGTEIDEIPDSAFYGMQNLEDISLPKKAKVIGNVILKNCPKLRKVRLPKRPVSIGEKAFEGINPQIIRK
jgi:hypothetical protein